MKKRRTISKYIAEIIVGLGNYIFYISAVNEYMAICYMFAGFIIFVTTLASVNLYILSSKQIAYAMKFHGHSWLIFVNALAFSSTLYYLQWDILLILYGTLVIFGLCKRINGYFEISTMTESDLKEIELSIDKLKKSITQK